VVEFLVIISLHVSEGERILKTAQHSVKLWARVGCAVFFLTRRV